MKKSRLIICKDCSSFKQCVNENIGECLLEENVVNLVWYNSQCLYGLSEFVETPSISLTTKE